MVHMSSTAHWLVLGAVASGERVLSTWWKLSVQHTTQRTHRICTLIERKHFHACLLIQAHTFRGLKSPSSRELELCCCPSAGHFLPSPHFHGSSFSFLSQCHPCVGVEVAAILDSLKEGKEQKKSHLPFTSSFYNICLHAPPLK